MAALEWPEYILAPVHEHDYFEVQCRTAASRTDWRAA
jgi:hypothetical protein